MSGEWLAFIVVFVCVLVIAVVICAYEAWRW